MDPTEAGKTAFICYRQLEELLAVLGQSSVPGMGYSLDACARAYNQVLSGLAECFSLDSAFARRIGSLQPVSETEVTTETWQTLRTDGPFLRGTARAFVELYLSADDKKKAVGFNP